MKTFENIAIDQKGFVKTITINRPEKLNALNKATISELSESIGQAEEDSSVRVIIITGSGAKAFVAGADISEFAHFSKEEGEELSRQGHEILFNKIEQLSKPVIAAVNGFALGGGLELAMACHIRIASENAKLGLPEVSLGVIPGYGGTQRLPQLVGKGKALEMICSASMISATEALQWGLVNDVVPQESLIEKAEALAAKITNNSPIAIAAAISSVNAAYKDGINGLEIEIKEFGNSFGTHDFKEGTEAFLQKRKPLFKGFEK
jgi:enoyl-CoA hydratase